MTGEESIFAFWAEPNPDGGRAENYAFLNQLYGCWCDGQAKWRFPVICEWKPAGAARAPAAAAPVDLARGLVGHWKFDEGRGALARDSSGRGNHGRLVNGPRRVKGRVGGALSFDGRDDYVEIPNESDYDLSRAVSYSVWVRISAFDKDWMAVVSKGDNMNLQRKGGERFLTWQTKDCPDTISQYQLDGATHLTDGRWHHMACTYDGARKCIYEDGRPANSAKATGFIENTDYPVELGRNGYHARLRTGLGPLSFNGLMDDVRIYNRARAAEEIRLLARPEERAGPAKDTRPAPALTLDLGPRPDGRPGNVTMEFVYTGNACRSALRGYLSRSSRNTDRGFRVAVRPFSRLRSSLRTGRLSRPGRKPT